MKPLELSESAGVWFFAGLVLTVYLWATPWRDLYGIEARNALMAREMLQGGWSFIPTAMGRPYLDYLPLYFWLEALFAWPSGRVTTWSAVFPSAIAGAGMVLFTWRLGREINNRVAWLAALILATLPGFWLAASRATIDMVLALGVCVTVFSLFRADASRQFKAPSSVAADGHDRGRGRLSHQRTRWAGPSGNSLGRISHSGKALEGVCCVSSSSA